MSHRHSSRRKMLKLAGKLRGISPEAAVKIKLFSKNENDRLILWAKTTPNDRPERS